MNHNINWKNISDLKDPFNDAINYKSKDQKEFFSKIFVRTAELNKCLDNSIYYLIGEKGSGKTAYAVYLENNPIQETQCKLTTMTETQYKRFIALKQQGKLTYSDYANIWRSILLLLICQLVKEKSKRFYHKITGKFNEVEAAIDTFNNDALNPEIESAFEMLLDSKVNAKLTNNDIGGIEAESRQTDKENSQKIKIHLLQTENTLKHALNELKIKNNHILFIDGIDFKPGEVPYNEYIECIKGLAEAAWQLNTEFFNTIKDSKGRIKVVLLLRPDVFHILNLYNSNSRLRDNSILLNWSTTEKDYLSSKLFDTADKFLSTQQDFQSQRGEAWKQYFNGEFESRQTFKNFLKNSFHKPRDILTYIKTIKAQHATENKLNNNIFIKDIVDGIHVKREYSDYLLGEIRNYASFYMSESDFGMYLKFFQYLNGKPTFSVDEFKSAFNNFSEWASRENISNLQYMKDHETLLQFFYDINIMGYKEVAKDGGEQFYHWCHKERTINNIYPKVKGVSHLMLNTGIAKALDIGKETTAIKPQQNRRKRKRS